MKRLGIRQFGVIFLCLLLLGCAGMPTIELADNAGEVLMDTTVSTMGFLIIKNNPKFRDPMITWYTVFRALDDFSLIQKKYQEGIEELSAAISHEPFLVMQFQNMMRMVKITPAGPQTPEELPKYMELIDSFMLGVMSTPITL